MERLYPIATSSCQFGSTDLQINPPSVNTDIYDLVVYRYLSKKNVSFGSTKFSKYKIAVFFVLMIF